MKSKGFTMIELLVVIALIGIVIAIMFASFGDARKQSRDKARAADIQNIRIALEKYQSICKNYPSSLDQSANNCDRNTITFGDVYKGNITDPMGNNYLYVGLGSDCKDYHIGAVLEVKNSKLFDEDHDFNSKTLPRCGGVGVRFDGASDDTLKRYDFKKFNR